MRVSTSNQMSRVVLSGLVVLLVSCGGEDEPNDRDGGVADAGGGPPRTFRIPGVQEVREDCTGTFDFSAPFFDANDLNSSEFVEFVADGSRIVLRGILGPNDAGKLEAVLSEHPEIRTLVFANVPGTIAARDGTPELARLVRERNLATCLPAGGYVASGGATLFLSGSVRLLLGQVVGGGVCQAGQPCPGCRGGRDTCVGVHDFFDVDSMSAGRELPRNHVIHESERALLIDLGIDPAFHDFAVDAASHEESYFLNRSDLEQWMIVTNNACTDIPARAICHSPAGAYNESCASCEYTAPTLSCSCENGSGASKATDIDVDACGATVQNCLGDLTCDSCGNRADAGVSPDASSAPDTGPSCIPRAGSCLRNPGACCSGLQCILSGDGTTGLCA